MIYIYIYSLIPKTFLRRIGKRSLEGNKKERTKNKLRVMVEKESVIV